MEQYKVTIPPREISSDEIEGISDPTEKRFAIAAFTEGYRIYTDTMITLPKDVEGKRSTNPDFIVLKDGNNPLNDGVFVEITERSTKAAGKKAQSYVMRLAGLGNRYVQLTKDEVIIIETEGLGRYLLTRIVKA